MKKLIQIVLLIGFSLIATQTLAQDAAVTGGPVWRIQYVKIKPGKTADYMKWLREYRVRVLIEQKSAGLILDYKFFTKPTSDNSAEDWDIAGAVLYRNYAEALDGNPEMAKKMPEIVQKVFGSGENQRKVWAELRDPSSEVVASRIFRELVVTPAKPASGGN